MSAGWGSFSEFIAGNRDDGVHPLAPVVRGGGGPEAQVVSFEDAAEDSALRHLTAGYRPGAILDAASRAQSLQLQITEEERRISRAEKASRHWMNMFEQGRIDAWQMQDLLPTDSGDPAKLARLRQQLDAVQRQSAEAGGAMERASSMAGQMYAGSDWQAQRAQRMADAGNERLAQRAAENDAWFRGYLTRHHTRELARAQSRGPVASCPQCAAMGATEAESAAICGHATRHTPSGTGWPAERGELTRATRAGFAVSA